MVQRVLSLNGLSLMHLPFWASIDQRASDLPDLLFNEPWFLIEGLLWTAVAWSTVGGASANRLDQRLSPTIRSVLTDGKRKGSNDEGLWRG